MSYAIVLHHRPALDNPDITEQIAHIAQELTGEWFTPDVAESIHLDLLFQDALCLEVEGKVFAFILFTGCDGAISITIMGASPGFRRRGYGSDLMEYLIRHASELGFNRIEVLTVPPAQKPHYGATIHFYEKHGFIIEKELTGLWQSGSALKLVRRWTQPELGN